MGVGYFIGFGLNYVDPDQYEGWDGELQAAENDVRDMARVAEMASFKKWGYLIGEKATKSNLVDSLMKLSVTARRGDIVWIAYSGHGIQYQDRGKKYEGYCLYDGIFPEAEMRNLIATLQPGVRVLVTLDCCHSGGFYKSLMVTKQTLLSSEAGLGKTIVKAMPFDLAMTMKATPLSKMSSKLPLNGGQYIKWMSACQKSEVALDGQRNGVFTSALLVAVRDSNEANYKLMFRTISELCAPVQHPQLKNTSEVNFSDLERFLKV